MNKKSTLILLSILHICILGICVLTIYSNKNSASDVMVAHVSSDTKVIDSQAEPEAEATAEPETVTEPEPEPITEPEPEAEALAEPEAETESIAEPETEAITEPESEVSPLYSFHYVGTHSNLNIRSTPSTSGTIIGKVPVGGDGSVIELTNDAWALIDYQGIIGYCSRNCIKLQEIDQ
ncbi:MAG: SH3 domain-containing protein [Acetatifactor sp.]|nr:SH3 domain-containing protein [Acetatifactor sp.]